MSKTFKSLVILLCVSVMITLLSACTNSTNSNEIPVISDKEKIDESNTEIEEANNSNSPITFTMLMRDEASFPYNEEWIIWDEITEMTGVTLKPTVVPSSDWDTKLDLLISSGDAPDFITRIGPQTVDKYLPANAMLPISDYYNLMPNYKNKLKEFRLEEEVNSQLKRLDGKIYSIPAIQEEIWYEYYMAYRADIFEKVGLTPPKTFDELYEILKALKKSYPNVIPWVDKWNGRVMGALTQGTWACNAGNGVGLGAASLFYVEEEDKFVYNARRSEYREFLKFLNKLGKEGLYDTEVFTISGDQVVERLTTGKGFISISNTSEVVEWNDFGKQNVGPEFEFVQFLPPAGPKGSVARRAHHLGGGGADGAAIPATTAQNENLERLIGFIDWLFYSDEAIDLVWWGKEGVTYKVVNGDKQPLDDITYRWMNPGKPRDMRKDLGVGIFTFMGATPKEYRYDMLPPEEQELQKLAATERPLQPPAPVVLYTAEEQEEYNILISDLNDYAKQMYVKFVVGESDPESDWDSYIEVLKTKGVERLEELVNTSYEKTKAALSK